ncbi:DUF3833 domain-containing protein [Herbaspirillum huttiense]|uniref:DUF3833 domain-containing protein n=3 Tax=Bacteria TaxID=2 RepID=A0AAJ2LT00_9BURK|nr:MULTISPECIES: DUF3833 domain-containing protein [Herbaspirillum]MAF04518.1 DUF3833 domain-containing protein [Herbaspirillum sp.]MBO14484.1 DUF3833 domain-containing protein [Herbaspirillum sp.]MDR9838427.1 DUF3833 domain-containing protein [Herbaspirillum huttiense]MEE1638474.1 DUF3833 domain-containing protein [Herbaspirillum huttiense NC40101]|tara:strand:- start:2589 stop:3158 length:570 start_codon:yes stop_codon:yes gene_type:complete
MNAKLMRTGLPARLWKGIALALLALVLGGCASQQISDYAGKTPVFDPAVFFKGRTEAWGMFQKRGGEVARRFHVVVTGTVDGNTLTLDERFRYDDGETQTRVWTLVRQPDNSWRGRAGDVIGEAIGHTAGNALHWNYTLLLPVNDKQYEVQMDDWMYQMDERTLINRTSMSKFGVEVGQVTLFFRKEGV